MLMEYENMGLSLPNKILFMHTATFYGWNAFPFAQELPTLPGN